MTAEDLNSEIRHLREACTKLQRERDAALQSADNAEDLRTMTADNFRAMKHEIATLKERLNGQAPLSSAGLPLNPTAPAFAQQMLGLLQRGGEPLLYGSGDCSWLATLMAGQRAHDHECLRIVALCLTHLGELHWSGPPTPLHKQLTDLLTDLREKIKGRRL